MVVARACVSTQTRSHMDEVKAPRNQFDFQGVRDSSGGLAGAAHGQGYRDDSVPHGGSLEKHGRNRQAIRRSIASSSKWYQKVMDIQPNRWVQRK